MSEESALVQFGVIASLRPVLESGIQVKLLGDWVGNGTKISLFFFFVVSFIALVFATNFRVKASMKNSILLSWEIRDKNPSQPFTVSTFLLGW